MSGAKIAQMRTIPHSTSPVMSIPRCSPTDWRRWETIGSRENQDFLAFSSNASAGTPEPGATSAKISVDGVRDWFCGLSGVDISTSLSGR